MLFGGIDMIRNWRLLLLLITVIGAILAIGMKTYPYGRNGVEIIYVPGESPAAGILEQGMIVTRVNGEAIKNVDDWNRLTANPGSIGRGGFMLPGVRATGRFLTRCGDIKKSVLWKRKRPKNCSK